ncbi:MAG: DNA repair protein RecO [Candidatus Sungbacteria bacterium]|uniref:DNA repair protein RecO n=1 Tax=Candidatus Sungiibacteriota bacterium TaxID=2750080 RepID=A0A932VSG8_9BACT|nr:DNA repair protein RecO [Candidatus Sungbacteria bacterium]
MYATDAIVLKKLDVGEADVLYMLYARDYGKMRAVAPGIRKSEAKLRGHLEPLSLSRIRFVNGKQREKLIGARLLNFWSGFRADRARLAVAHYVAARIDQECMEGEQDQALWNLLCAHLAFLDAADTEVNLSAFVSRFEDQLSEVLGYGPGGAERPERAIIGAWANWMN